MLKFLPALFLLAATAVFAAPPEPPVNNEISRLADTSVLTSGHEGYAFHRFDLNDEDGRPHRVFVAVPKAAPPEGGFAALYALDGNALLEFLPAARLRPPLEQLPLLVLIGYPTERRFDTAARAWDYTPPGPQGQPLPDPVAKERVNGGAAAFLRFIERQVRPRVEQLAHTDARRQTLWGHSYGGLFVLYTLLNQPQAFTRYIAADPSLWWQKGLMLQYAQQALERLERSAFSGRWMLIQKSGRADDKRPANAQQAAMLARREEMTRAVAPEAAAQLAQRLAGHGLRADYAAFAGLTHGGLLAESFKQALGQAAQPALPLEK